VIRSDLDREMREVLVQLASCSHVPAAPWQPSGRSRSSDETPGGTRPPGDLGHTRYARDYGPPFHERSRQYPGAVTNEQRRRVLERARTELEQLRGRGVKPRPAGESIQQRNARIIAEGTGWTVREVAIHFRCGEREVRRVRAAAGREPEYGRVPERDPDAERRRRRARELIDTGHTLAQIARLLSVSRSTIERDLGRRAA
jgi:DNA invertase Pin-like site-specific DNA recombinase